MMHIESEIHSRLAIFCFTEDKLVKLQIESTHDVAFSVYAQISNALGNTFQTDGVNDKGIPKVKCNILFEKRKDRMPIFQSCCQNFKSDVPWKLYNIINQLKEGENFILVLCDSNWLPRDEERQKVTYLLMSKRTGISTLDLERSFNEYSKDILKYYDCLSAHHAGKERTTIDKDTVQSNHCRLCGRGVSDGATFSKKAHAISELVGNKSILLLGECDDCNGETINLLEDSLAVYLSAIRTLTSLKGKNGAPKYNEDGLKIQTLPNGIVGIEMRSDKGQIEELPGGELRLEFTMSPGSYVPERIYKILCKFAISVLPSKYYDFATFQPLCDWILDKNQSPDALPLVALKTEVTKSPHHPQISVYKRKHDINADVPLYLCSFYAATTSFLFELPLLEKQIVLKDKNSFDRLFARIPMLKGDGMWKYENYGSKERVKLRDKIRFIANKRLPKQD